MRSVEKVSIVDAQSEKYALGTLLGHEGLMEAALYLLNHKSFALADSRALFEALKDLHKRKIPFEHQQVVQELQKNPFLGNGAMDSEIRALAIFNEYDSGRLPIDSFEFYAKRVKKTAIARSIHKAVEEAKNAMDMGEDIKETVDRLNLVLELIDEPDENHEMDLSVEIKTAIERTKRRAAGDLSDLGFLTGIEDLDKLVRLRNGELVVIGARPGSGKTVLLNQIRLNTILGQGLRTGFISLEMSSEQLADRCVASLAGISMNHIQGREQINENDLSLVVGVGDLMPEGKNFTHYKPDMTIKSIRSVARSWKRKHDIDILILDYTQLIESDHEKKKGNRAEAVAEMSRGMKLMAKELQIPIVAASQLNRDAEECDRPGMRHLRESGAIEQDADIVLLLSQMDQKDEVNQRTLCQVEKNRNGRCGDVVLNFRKPVQQMK